MPVEQYIKIQNGTTKPGPTFDADNIPTADEKAAQAGTNGTPGDGNRFVTDSDPRLVGAAANESNGPFRMVHYGAFAQNTVLAIFDADGAYQDFTMPASGSIVKAVLRTDDPRTAGQLDAKLTKNGSPLVGALDMTLDGTNPSSHAQNVAPSTAPYTFVAGDRLGIELTSDAGWLPDIGVSTVITVDFFVTFN